MADTTEARYYDPKTGKATESAHRLVADFYTGLDPADEVARLERERDETRVERDAARKELDTRGMAAESALTDIWNDVSPGEGEWEYPWQVVRAVRELEERRSEFGTKQLTALTTERAAREKAERERDEALQHLSPLSCTQGKDGIAAKVKALIDDLVATALAQGIAEHEAATLRAELRQARRRERVMAMGVGVRFHIGRGWFPFADTVPETHGEGGKLWHLIYVALSKLRRPNGLETFPDHKSALDAAWDALHAAGLVEDEDA